MNARKLNVSINARFTRFALIAICIITYWPGFNNQFNNWDDFAYVTGNPNLYLNWQNLLSSFTNGEHHGMYLPLTALSFSLSWWFAGFSPFPYIFVNLFIHVVNTFLVRHFSTLVCKSRLTGFITAMLFAIHPVQAESVVYVSGRRDVLFSFFLLIAVLTYTKWLGDKSMRTFMKANGAYMLALLSKTVSVIFFPLMILLDWFFDSSFLKSPKYWLLKVPALVLALFFSFITIQKSISSTDYGMNQDGLEMELTERLMNASYSYVNHFKLAVLPTDQSTVHPYPATISLLYPVIASLLIISAIILMFRTNNRIVAFGFSFFTISIFPLIQFFPNSYGIVNEHYLYFSSIGIFLIIANGFTAMLNRPGFSRKFKFLLSATFVVLIMSVTRGRARVFQNSVSFWTDAIDSYPDHGFFYMKRGLAYENEYENLKAIDDYDKAISINPNDFGSKLNRVNALFNSNQFTTASIAIDELQESYPNMPYLLFKEGLVAIELENYSLAKANFRKCIDAGFETAYSYNNLGLALAKSGNVDDAIVQIETSLTLDSLNEKAFYYLAQCRALKLDTIAACNALGRSIPLVKNPIERQLRYDEYVQLCGDSIELVRETVFITNDNEILVK